MQCLQIYAVLFNRKLFTFVLLINLKFLYSQFHFEGIQ